MTAAPRSAPAAGVPRAGSRTTVNWRARRVVLLLTDLTVLGAGLTLASVARYDGDLAQLDRAGLLLGVAVLFGAYVLAAAAVGLHRGRHLVGSADEVLCLVVAVTVAALVTTAFDSVLPARPHLFPLSAPLLGGALAFLVLVAVRQLFSRQRARRRRALGGRRVLVFGAGDAGAQLIRSMLADPRSWYRPVGLLDDDPHKRSLRIEGIRVRGGRDDIAGAALSADADLLIIALPSGDAATIRELTHAAVEAGLQVQVLPGLQELLGSRISIRDVRDIDIDDLLGRRQLDTDVAEIAGYLVGKRVLVTGAGGSIGSELCIQVARYAPAELIMLDRDESALHGVQLALHGEARLDQPDVVLADIRDSKSLDAIFAERRPQVVFHAAALKHVNMLEQYPDEAWKTNVLGTRNVLAAAARVGVEHLINVSTDKAADPVNVLGRTKRMAEQLTAAYAQDASGSFMSVRFGNVLGSRGSVLATFAAQIARGGPLTVTHPEVTRYFMTIPEAVQLVIQAGAIGAAGEALVLDMGEPVRIADVARQLIEISGRDLEIVFTGLRPGEKMHEELFSSHEQGVRRAHPLITHVPVEPMDPWVMGKLGRRFTDLTGRPAAEPFTVVPRTGQPERV